MKSVRIRSYSGPNFPALGLTKERYGVVFKYELTLNQRGFFTGWYYLNVN